jgi:hypothetical protein
MVKKYGSNKKYCDNESINYFDIQPNKKQYINQSIEGKNKYLIYIYNHIFH